MGCRRILKKKKWVSSQSFAFDLCEKLSFPHPDYLLELLDWQQFTDWIIYYTDDDDPHAEEMDRIMNKCKAAESGEANYIDSEYQSHSLG